MIRFEPWLLLLMLRLPQTRSFTPVQPHRSPTVGATGATGANRKATLLVLKSSRRDSDYWENEREPNEEPSADKRPYRDASLGGSRAQQELQNMPLASANDDYDDFYYDDDRVEEEATEFAPLDRPRQRGGLPQRRRADYDFDYFDEQMEEEGDDDQSQGNFWSNPSASLDPGPLASSRSRQNVPSVRRSGSPRRRKTSFRSGIPQPPPPVSELYNRLFWYGFDPAETESPADKTMFGGTKGKFNGLAFMYNGGITMPDSERRRKPRNDVDKMDTDDYYAREAEQDGYYAGEDDYDASRDITPPFDAPSFQSSDQRRVPSRQRTRRRQRRNKPRYEDDGAWSRPSRTSNWFDAETEYDDDDDDEEDAYFDNNPRRRNRQGDRTSEKPFNPFEVFLGLNRDNLNSKAIEYDRSMGLDYVEERPRRQRNPQRPRAGFAYPYNAAEDELSDDPPVAEFEAVLEEKDTKDSKYDSDPVEPSTEKQSSPESITSAKRKLTWEERSMAIERVPPADVPAWGPSGDLGVDARSHAISEATQDILQAQRKVESRETKVEKCREELSILKVDTELERKRLRKKRDDPRRIQQQLRDLDLEVEDAARAYRYAQLQLQAARDELAEVEARHWAVLSFYNPTQVENGIDEAFRELEESEPAVRRLKEKQMEEERNRQEELKQAEPAELEEDEADSDSSQFVA